MLKHTLTKNIASESDCYANINTKFYENILINEIQKFCCASCDFRTKTRTDLLIHALDKHLKFSGNEKYNCLKCSYQTHMKNNLNLHMFNKHNLESKSVIIVAKEDTNSHKAHTEKCNNTSKPENQHLENNTKIYFENIGNDSNQAETKSDSIRPIFRELSQENRNIDEMHCSECSFKTKRRASLNAHILDKHSMEKWFQCSECPYKSTTRHYLIAHKNYCHTPEENMDWYNCPECSFIAKRNSILKAHMLQNHGATTN